MVTTAYVLKRTMFGRRLEAIGEDLKSSDSMGLKIAKTQFIATCVGGAFAGLSGVYLTLSYVPYWTDGMTAGRGWIALALVVFATWKPERVLIGAYIFGGVTILHMNLQALGLRFPGQFFSMAPYLATIVVLVLISSNKLRIKLSAPASLTIPFYKGR